MHGIKGSVPVWASKTGTTLEVEGSFSSTIGAGLHKTMEDHLYAHITIAITTLHMH